MPVSRSLLAVVLSVFPAVALGDVPSVDVEYHDPVGVDVDSAWAELGGVLEDLSDRSANVYRGEVLTTREDIVGVGPVTKVAIVVDETLRGPTQPGALVELYVPLEGPISGDRPQRPVPVRGYEVLVFADESGALLEGGMFIVEGGYAWRSTRRGVLMSPRLQRDWGEVIDPIGDYDVFHLDEIRGATERSGFNGGKRWWRR
jgi:hypothetical protein